MAKAVIAVKARAMEAVLRALGNQVVIRLQIDPELRRRVESLGKEPGGFRCYPRYHVRGDWLADHVADLQRGRGVGILRTHGPG